MLDFLFQLYEEKVGYSAINTAKSSISSFCALVNGRDIGNETIIKRFMKGIFVTRPSLPKYSKIWDVNKVLSYLSNISNNDELTMLQLSQKLAILLMLLTGQRCQSIHLLKLNDIQVERDKIVGYVSDLIKQTKPGKHIEPFVIKRYLENQKLCCVQTLVDYIARTADVRKDEQKLFISCVKPFRAVTKSTISRWIKTIMGNAGININVFGVHSCRAASTSLAASKGLNIDIIMKAAGWSSASTFRRFYHKDIEDDSFSTTLLSKKS